mmetsp:Transcript_32948/g.57773  ORF Transcript_32948/g.57773 Transcript_32948/m.57773 type:complete len:225 (+) Transcript_32948:8176-8850(+)
MEAGPKLIVVLVAAPLETTRVKKTGEYQLLNSDDHAHIISKAGGSPMDYRPDILHHSLLALLDSPMNKAGLLQVYVQTTKNVLIYINPKIRLPRTYKRFAGLMVQVLHTRKIKAAETSEVLMKVIKNPITAHLPVGSVKIGTSETSQLVDIFEYIKDPAFAFTATDSNQPTNTPVFFVGACAHGHPGKEIDFLDTHVSISMYNLSAAACLSRITAAFERLYSIN